MGAKESPQTTQTNKVELSDGQKAIEKLLIPQAKAAANTNYTAFGGPTVAGFNAADQQAQQGVLDAATGMGSLAQSGNAAQSFLLNPDILNPASNPHLKAQGDALSTQIGDNFARVIMPNLRSADVQASGMYSGGNTKQGIAQGLAAGEATKNISQSLTDLYYKSYSTGLDAMGRAVGANPQTIAANLIAPSAVGAVGEQQRSLSQAQMDAEQAKYYFNQFAPMMKAQDLASLIGVMPGGSGVSTVTGATPQSGGIKGVLGGAASGAAIGSMVPGIGTAIGAGLGGLAGFFS